MRAVAAGEIAGADRLLAVGADQGRGHAVVVLLESGQADAAFDRRPELGKAFPQNPFGGVLRHQHEPERHVARHRDVEARHLLAVDVDDLPPHLDGGIEHLAQHAHALVDLQGARLHADGLGVLRRFEQRIDDADVNAAAAQFDRGGETDGSASGDEHIDVGHAESFGRGRGCTEYRGRGCIGAGAYPRGRGRGRFGDVRAGIPTGWTYRSSRRRVSATAAT